jgi:hypothetical protein
VLQSSSVYRHAVANTPAGSLDAVVLSSSGCGLPRFLRRVGSCIVPFEACSAFTHVTACLLAESPKATLFSEYFNDFVTSAVAPIATGWNDQLPGGTFTR